MPRRNGKNVLKDGTIKYYKKYFLHRDNGPAIIHPNSEVEFWEDGRRATHYKTPYGYKVIFRSSIVHRRNSKDIYKIEKIINLTNEFQPTKDRPSFIQYYYYRLTDMVPDCIEIKYLNKQGKHHRINGPAHIELDKTKRIVSEMWVRNGKYYRTDGPSHTSISNNIKTETWISNEILHNEEGPAEIKTDLTTNQIFSKLYFLNGVEYTEDEWFVRTRKTKLKKLLRK